MTDPWFIGARPEPDGSTRFGVWAPYARCIEVCLADGRCEPMYPAGRGYFEARIPQTPPGTRYTYALDGSPGRPDPASRSQPEGVHGPSEVVDPAFPWTVEHWSGLPLRKYVIYELHIGTFTPEGTFDAAIARLVELRDLGITAVEVMPIAQFPGERNWGYDGVAPYAAQHSYGGVHGLKRFVDACHARGLCVVLDVVYNHLGPEGNYLDQFGPYFTDRYRTPWGRALNFDGPDSDEVRLYFIGNALYWVDECRIDALRLDAVHAIVDPSPRPFIQALTEAVHTRAEELGRRIHLIAESAANDARLITPIAQSGCGADAQWNDDFHHALRTLVTGERQAYYASYGRAEHLARAFRDGYVYTGQRSAFHRREHGSPTGTIPAERFVVFGQNHDHVGNRARGERPTVLVSFDQLRLMAAAVILSPYIPLLFMGEEYAETAPFLYFISHGDEALVDAVRRGRREEFAAFADQGEPPDPQDEQTFRASKLNHDLKRSPRHAAMLAYYRELLRLRRETPALADLSRERLVAVPDERRKVVTVHRWSREGEAFLALNFSDEDRAFEPPGVGAHWRILVQSSDRRWGGERDLPAGDAAPGDPLTLAPWSAALLDRSPQEA